jgi:peptide/nickel transport system permease protein
MRSSIHASASEASRPAASEWARFLRRAPRIPAAILVATLALAIAGDWVAPHSPIAINPRQGELPPAFLPGGTWAHPLGTDRQGRDVLSRMIVGTKYSIAVAVTVTVLGGLFGSAVGAIAGYRGGLTDVVLMRTVDACLTFPGILLALVLVASLGPGFWVVVLVLAFGVWPRFSRLVRAEVLSCKQRDFVALARVAGGRGFYIMLKHIVPNTVNSVVVLATLQIGWAIVIEATLGFLGVGIPPPTPTWGNIVADGRTYIASAWWISVFPGVAITAVVLAFNMLGDWLRDALDPTLRQV